MLVALLATLPGSAGARQPAPEAAPRWRTIVNQGFENSFPAGNWVVRDNNGSTVGTPSAPGATVVWDDTSTKPHTGFWSLHPNDYSSYANFTDTSVAYGPIDLTGARDARVRFSYWLDTEKHYDFFTWSYSCRNNGNWTSRSVSGVVQNWVDVTMSLRACRGSNNVKVQWTFTADYSGPGAGVWLDDVRIQKLA